MATPKLKEMREVKEVPTPDGSFPTCEFQPVAADKKWRWGVMGSGGICQDFSHAIRDALPDAVLEAIGARDLDRAQKVADEYGFKKAYGSFEEVAADPDVDIVYVGTIHNKHAEHALLALKHNKPVLIEKSFTMNAKEAEQIFQLAKEKNLFVMEAYWTRFMPWCGKLREIIKNKTIGDIYHVMCDFSIQFDRKVQRIFDPNLCGGSLLDVGIYPVSIASMIFGGGIPEQIIAVGDLLDTGVDGHIAITLKYAKNQTAQLFCGALADGPNILQIIGSKGRVRVHDDKTGYWHCAPGLTLTIKGSDGNYHEEHFKYPKPKSQGKYNFKNSEMLAFEAHEVHRCLYAKKTESEDMTHQETLTIMKTLDEIRRQIGVKYPGE